MAILLEPRVLSASSLAKDEVVNNEGENLGGVVDFMIEVDTGHIAYVVVGLWVNVWKETRRFAVPWSALKLSLHDKKFVFNMTREWMDGAKALDNDNWPDWADRGWGSEVYRLHGVVPYWETHVKPAISGDAPLVLSANNMSGTKVTNINGENLGKVEELMIDLPTGRVAYAVLSFGGMLGMGEKLFAIPWPALHMSRHDRVFLLDAPQEKLKLAEGFDNNNWPDTADGQFGLRMYQYYDYPPFWAA